MRKRPIMVMSSVVGLLVASSLPGPGRAVAGPAKGEWSAEEQTFWDKLQEELDEFSKKANDHCGTEITASYVKESFRGRLTAGGNYGLSIDDRGLCTAALSAVRDVCLNGDKYKKAMRAKVKRVECEWGKKRFTLKAGTFHETSTNTDPRYHYQDHLRALTQFLEKKL